MHVREIDTTAGFEALRGDWEAAYAADPLATPFVSWPWLRGWIDVTPYSWSVLAVREGDDSPFTGFLPISWRGSRSALRIDHLREIHMAGEPTADYTGFVCHPLSQESAISALAEHVAHDLSWDHIRFEEVSDPRLPLFLASIPQSFSVLEHQGTPCPRMPLPATWQAYLANLSSATRQSLRRRMKHADAEFRCTRFDGVNDERQIDALIDMSIKRTREHSDPHAWRLHSMLRHCAKAGLAHMVMLWKDDTPIAGVAGLINRKTRSFALYVTSFDEQFAEFSPGRVAVAITIRDAIEMGLSEFDFTRGEEHYKFQFGAISAHNRTLIIERPSLQAALRRGISGVRDALRI